MYYLTSTYVRNCFVVHITDLYVVMVNSKIMVSVVRDIYLLLPNIEAKRNI